MTLLLTKLSTFNFSNAVEAILIRSKDAGGLAISAQQAGRISERCEARGLGTAKIAHYEDETAAQAFAQYLEQVAEGFKTTNEAQAYYNAETFRPFEVEAVEEKQTASGRGTSAATNTEKYNAISTTTGKTTTETKNEGSNTQNTESTRTRRLGDEWDRLHNFEGKDVYDVLIDAIFAGLIKRSDYEYQFEKVEL